MRALPGSLASVDGTVESIESAAMRMAFACASGACSPEELAAWIVRVARPAPIRCGGIEIDTVDRSVRREGVAVSLLAREYRLLLHLARRAGECVSRRDLLAAVWGLRFDPGTNVVAVHVSRLRGRLDPGFATSAIETVKGVGYRLVG